MSLRQIAQKYETDHHKVKRRLVLYGVVIRERPIKKETRKYKTLLEAHYANMKYHLRFNVSMSWLMQFDFDKLKILNEAIINRDNRYSMDTSWYIKYIEYFHDDPQFIIIYTKYKNNPCKYMKPSLDHIVPKSKGGTNDLSNLQFLSWFENRCKNDLTQDEWNNIKNKMEDYIL